MDRDKDPDTVGDTQSLPRAHYWEPTGNDYTYRTNQLPMADYGLYVEEKGWEGHYMEIGYALRKMGILNPNTMIPHTNNLFIILCQCLFLI